MRYALISDIHSNRQAINVVLTDIKLNKIDAVICLGDIVGYGPSPREVIDICYKNINHFILGNHDAAVAGKILTDNFNDNAKFLIEWTSARLDEGHKKFFSSIPLMLKGANFRCSHGSLRHPGRFLYILEEEEAVDEFKAFPEQIAFVGHSHVPGIFVVGASGKAHWLEPTDFNMEDGKRYIVNVGSVGQPRDDDIRASYCIFDTEKGDVLFRKVVFDIEAYRTDQMKAGLPENTSYFVEFYKTHIPKPLHNTIGFKPLSAENAVCTVEELKSLEFEIKKLRKTKFLLLTFVLIAILLSVVFAISYLKTHQEKQKVVNLAEQVQKELAKKTKTIYKTETITPLQPPLALETEIITMPSPGITASPREPFVNWIVELTDPENQSIQSALLEDKKSAFNAFILKSNTTEDLVLKFLPIEVKKGNRFSASAQFKKIFLDAGHITLALLLEKPDGTTEILASNTPKEIKTSDGWTRNTSVTIPSDKPLREDGLLYYAIIGNFKGEIHLRKCSLIQKK